MKLTGDDIRAVCEPDVVWLPAQGTARHVETHYVFQPFEDCLELEIIEYDMRRAQNTEWGWKLTDIGNVTGKGSERAGEGYCSFEEALDAAVEWYESELADVEWPDPEVACQLGPSGVVPSKL